MRNVRTRLLLVLVGALTVALAFAIAGFDVVLTRAASNDVNTELRARAAAELAEIRVKGATVIDTFRRDESPIDSRVWIFDGDRVVEQPAGLTQVNLAAHALAGGPRRFFDVPGVEQRLLATPIVSHGRRAGTLVTGLSLRPYHQTLRRARVVAVTVFLLVLAFASVAAWWLLRAALRPVAQMTAQAEAWSDEDLDRRFALGEPHDELTRLARTLDGLLERLAASLRHERRFSAEMSHELRTPLAKLMAEAELALRRERSGAEYRESLAAVMSNAQQIERIVSALVTAAQQDAKPQGVANAVEVAEAVVAAYSDDASSRGVDLRLVGSADGLRVGVDRELAERILHPVVENALRYGREQVRVRVARNGTAVLFAVDDDGPGVTPDEHEAIFEPAVRGSAGRSSATGAGLGLALARRLARAVAGDVEAHPGSGGRFVVRLPAV